MQALAWQVYSSEHLTVSLQKVHGLRCVQLSPLQRTHRMQLSLSRTTSSLSSKMEGGETLKLAEKKGGKKNQV